MSGKIPAQNTDSKAVLFSKKWFEAQSKEWLVYWAEDVYSENVELRDKIEKAADILRPQED